MGMIIALVNAKGGVGKTTLAVHLTAWLHLYGLKVALMDCDAQLLSSLWLRDAMPEIRVFTIEGEESSERAVAIDKQLPEIALANDVVVVDAPGGLGAEIGAVLLHADAALLPTGTSGLDWEGLYWTQATIEQIQEARNVLPEGLVLPVDSPKERRKYLLPNTAIIPVKAEDGHRATAELREFSQSVGFGMTTNTLPDRQKHKHITPMRFHREGKTDRPGKLMWQMGKSKLVRDAALDIDGVFQEVFPEIGQDDPYLVMRMVTPKSRWDEYLKDSYVGKSVANL